jgi:protein ImuA
MQRAAFTLSASVAHATTPASAALWRAGDGAAVGTVLAARASEEVCRATGFAALDAALPGGGWPQRGLIELLAAEETSDQAAHSLGHGALPLLAPAWARAEARQVWIAPPAWPYAPALAAMGWDVSQLVVVAAKETPHKDDSADQAWAAEQALRSRACNLVLWWCNERVPAAMLRRLHLAALDHGAALVAQRPLAARHQSSPAPLRLAMQAERGGMAVEVFKRRGPPLAQPLHLPWPAAWAAFANAPERVPSPKKTAHALVRSALAATAA